MMSAHPDLITIYNVNENHLSDLAKLFMQVFNEAPWQEDWTIEAVLKRLTDLFYTPEFHGLVATHNNTLVGFAMGYIEQWDTQRHFYLKEMCVKPQMQRHGIGTALMAALEERLSQVGVHKLYLLTARDGLAEAFYAKCGFYVSSKMIMMGKSICLRYD